jgi:hypothetical protein
MEGSFEERCLEELLRDAGILQRRERAVWEVRVSVGVFANWSALVSFNLVEEGEDDGRRVTYLSHY